MVEAKIDTDKKIFFILIFALVVFGIGRAYAYFSAKAESNEQTVTTGTLKLEVKNDGILRAQNIAPIDSNEIFSEATKLNFSIKNTGNIDLNATILLDVLNITEELKSNDLKWAIYSGETKINNGTFLNVANQIELGKNITILPTNSQNFDLYIWIEETGVPQDELQKGIIDVKVTVNATQ